MKSNFWRVEYEPFVAACSGVSGTDKQKLKKMIADLGGHLVSEWTKDCTLLVMKEVNVTAKVIGSLVSCRHIVTPNYVEKYLSAVTENASLLPDVTSFFPPVVERAINQDKSLFTLKEERRNIFNGKIFVFLSEKQHKRLRSVIELAGGTVVLYSQGNCDQSTLQESQTCVMQSEVSDLTQTPGSVTKEVEAILERKNLRMIAEAELGLAVLTISTSVYCNPTVAKEGVKLINCMKESQFINPTTQRVLVSDTQSSEMPENRTDHPTLGTHHPQRTSSKVGVSRKSEINLQQPESLSAERQQKLEVRVKKESFVTKSFVPDTEASDASVVPPDTLDKSRKSMKRPLPSEETARLSVVESSIEGQSRKKVKVESFDDEVPVTKIKEEPGDPGIVQPSDMGNSTAGQRVVAVKRELSAERIHIQDSEIDNCAGEIRSDMQDIGDSQSQQVDSESSQSQWRQKKRRRRLMSENDDDDDEESNQTEREKGPKETKTNGMSEVLQPLPGFISKDNPPEDSIKRENITSDPELRHHLVIVKTASLVVHQPVISNSVKANGSSDRNIKNFKKFKKSSYAGQSILPKIIGGSDLAVHHSMPSQASQEMFLADVQKKSDIDRAEALADELFSVEPKVKRMR